MKAMHVILWLCILSLVTGCSAIKTRYAYDTEADLTGLKTYAWLPQPDPSPGESPEEDDLKRTRARMLRASVDEELAREGMRLVTRDPDFLVSCHVIVEGKIEVDDWGYSYAARKRYRNPKGFGMVEVEQYDKGTLIIDFLTPGTKELIWRGEAQAGLDPKRTPEKGGEIGAKAVKKILSHFPPPAP